MTEPTATGLTLSLTSQVAPRPADGKGGRGDAAARSLGPLIDYTVVSSGTTAVLVNDRIYVGTSSASRTDDHIDALKAFVTAGTDGTAMVSKRTWEQKPAPGGPDFTIYFQGTVVAPGATVKGRAWVPLPFSVSIPGFARVPGQSTEATQLALPAAPKGWRFCLGVTPTVHEPDLLPGGAVALIANGITTGERAQRLLCSPVMPTPAAGGSASSSAAMSG